MHDLEPFCSTAKANKLHVHAGGKEQNNELSSPFSTMDIEPMLKSHEGSKIFAEALSQIRDGESLLKVLAQFIEFNSVFGTGVANLAAELAYHREFFLDPKDEIRATAARSCDVAAPIYFAAIDEFGRNKSHRAMAQDTLRETAKFFGFSKEKTNELTLPARATTKAVRSVMRGYCRAEKLTPRDLFNGIGFHMGSEILASGEFAALDTYMKNNQPDLVDYLRSVDAYVWVAIHPAVELDHFQESIEAANRALRYFSEGIKARAWIKNGFSSFALVQSEFMDSLKSLTRKTRHNAN